MRPLGCGCTLVDPIERPEALFPAYCPEAQKLQAEIGQAMKARDWDGMRLLGERLKRHREGRPDLQGARAYPLTKGAP